MHVAQPAAAGAASSRNPLVWFRDAWRDADPADKLKMMGTFVSAVALFADKAHLLAGAPYVGQLFSEKEVSVQLEQAMGIGLGSLQLSGNMVADIINASAYTGLDNHQFIAGVGRLVHSATNPASGLVLNVAEYAFRWMAHLTGLVSTEKQKKEFNGLLARAMNFAAGSYRQYKTTIDETRLASTAKVLLAEGNTYKVSPEQARIALTSFEPSYPGLEGLTVPLVGAEGSWGRTYRQYQTAVSSAPERMIQHVADSYTPYGGVVRAVMGVLRSKTGKGARRWDDDESEEEEEEEEGEGSGGTVDMHPDHSIRFARLLR